MFDTECPEHIEDFLPRWAPQRPLASFGPWRVIRCFHLGADLACVEWRNESGLIQYIASWSISHHYERGFAGLSSPKRFSKEWESNWERQCQHLRNKAQTLDNLP